MGCWLVCFLIFSSSFTSGIGIVVASRFVAAASVEHDESYEFVHSDKWQVTSVGGMWQLRWQGMKDKKPMGSVQARFFLLLAMASLFPSMVNSFPEANPAG